jgi:acetyltransferase-like isoleucine patch superfamily enzyme
MKNPLPAAAVGGSQKVEVRLLGGNTVDLSDVQSRKGLINLAHENTGTGNVVRFASGCKFDGSIEVHGSGNVIDVGTQCVIRGKIVVEGRNQRVTIGAHTTFVGVYLLCIEDCNLEIGAHCMFSRDIEIRTSDAHSIIDRATGRRINAAASVHIGNHVWIGVGALVSKGVRIADDSIVGAKSFVNGVFTEEGVVLAGAPARIVKRGVTWHRTRREQFDLEEIHRWRDAPAPGEPDAEIDSLAEPG